MAASSQSLRPSPTGNAPLAFARTHLPFHPKPIFRPNLLSKTLLTSQISRRQLIPILKVSQEDANDAGKEDGVSLGTMKLPPNTDLARFETLLFQWANSLSQGASLPLSAPIKVDRVKGGARLGFVEIVGDGAFEVPVYIDCVVSSAGDGDAGPMFRAVRNGPKKDRVAPDEPRIMRSLREALLKSAQIAAAAQ